MILNQPARGYRYSLDPFLLAGFCATRRGERILDLGAGVGVIGLLLAGRDPTVSVTGVEFDPDLARHAARNARDNALSGSVAVIRGDVRDATRFLPPEHFHRVVANPPFRKPGSGAISPHGDRALARHEISFSLIDLAAIAAAALRFGGVLDLIHLAERLPELFAALVANKLEPKKLRFVVPFPGSAPRLCLVSAIKGARPGLRLLPQLAVHERPGRYSRETASLLAGRPAGQPASEKKH